MSEHDHEELTQTPVHQKAPLDSGTLHLDPRAIEAGRPTPAMVDKMIGGAKHADSGHKNRPAASTGDAFSASLMYAASEMTKLVDSFAKLSARSTGDTMKDAELAKGLIPQAQRFAKEVHDTALEVKESQVPQSEVATAAGALAHIYPILAPSLGETERATFTNQMIESMKLLGGTSTPTAGVFSKDPLGDAIAVNFEVATSHVDDLATTSYADKKAATIPLRRAEGATHEIQTLIGQSSHRRNYAASAKSLAAKLDAAVDNITRTGLNAAPLKMMIDAITEKTK